MEQSAGNQNASLDRIDSNKGYKLGNIQWLCWRCNNHKKNAPDSDFIKMCQEVTSYQESLANPPSQPQLDPVLES